MNRQEWKWGHVRRNKYQRKAKKEGGRRAKNSLDSTSEGETSSFRKGSDVAPNVLREKASPNTRQEKDEPTWENGWKSEKEVAGIWENIKHDKTRIQKKKGKGRTRELNKGKK